MVGYLLLLKMLHCKAKINTKRKKSNICYINSINSLKTEVPMIKKEINDVEEQRTCRVCLKDGDIPIYGDNVDEILEALSTFGGISITSDDEYPKFLCHTCYDFLQAGLLFRKKAQQTDEVLRQRQNDIVLSSNDTADALNAQEFSDYDEITTDTDYFCKKCEISFKTYTEFSEHKLSAEHENIRRTCPICNKLYTVEYLKKHLLLHKLERQFMCDICGKNFPLQAPFKRHRVTHFYHLPFHCSLCPYKGRFRESLKMHMRSHTGEKPYQCSHCPSRFVNASNLNKHMSTHERSLKFKCESCGKGFYSKKDLGLHFKVDHTGLKEHICNVCGKAFGYRKQMMKHQLKVHKREKLKSGRMPLYLQVEHKHTLSTEQI